MRRAVSLAYLQDALDAQIGLLVQPHLNALMLPHTSYIPRSTFAHPTHKHPMLHRAPA